jgi:hypothetical protein
LPPAHREPAVQHCEILIPVGLPAEGFRRGGAQRNGALRTEQIKPELGWICVISSISCSSMTMAGSG